MAGKKNLGVVMVREHLRDLPQYPLPPGYTMRLYRPGDEAIWVAINDAADGLERITMAHFERYYFGDVAGLRQRMYFLCSPEGREVGTISAWYEREFLGLPFGRIHWVAILPEYQGRGLSKPMMTVAMNRLAELHERAYLTTSTARPVAIRVYLDFGFVPCLRDEEDVRRWRYAADYIVQPVLKDQTRWCDRRRTMDDGRATMAD